MQRTKRKSPPCGVCFVGISAKAGSDGPVAALCEKTLSGKIISKVEAELRTIRECSSFFRDNLVQVPPLQNGKLRYPSVLELETEWGFFEKRMAVMGSRVVILLGKLVADFFKTRKTITMIKITSPNTRLLKWVGIDENGTVILAVAHPSYVGIYARKHVEAYAGIITETVRHFLKASQSPTSILAH